MRAVRETTKVHRSKLPLQLLAQSGHQLFVSRSTFLPWAYVKPNTASVLANREWSHCRLTVLQVVGSVGKEAFMLSRYRPHVSLVHLLFRFDTEVLNDLACGRKLGFEKPLCAFGRHRVADADIKAEDGGALPHFRRIQGARNLGTEFLDDVGGRAGGGHQHEPALQVDAFQRFRDGRHVRQRSDTPAARNG